MVLTILSGPASAQESPKPAQPVQELFFTEVVYPQSRHEVQLTLGSFVDRTSADKSALAPVSVEFGLTDRLQLEGAWYGYSHYHDDPLRAEVVLHGDVLCFDLCDISVQILQSVRFGIKDGRQGCALNPFLAGPIAVEVETSGAGSAA